MDNFTDSFKSVVEIVVKLHTFLLIVIKFSDNYNENINRCYKKLHYMLGDVMVNVGVRAGGIFRAIKKNEAKNE